MNKEQRKFRKVIKARRLHERWKARMRRIDVVAHQFGGIHNVPAKILDRLDYKSKRSIRPLKKHIN